MKNIIKLVVVSLEDDFLKRLFKILDYNLEVIIKFLNINNCKVESEMEHLQKLSTLEKKKPFFQKTNLVIPSLYN